MWNVVLEYMFAAANGAGCSNAAGVCDIVIEAVIHAHIASDNGKKPCISVPNATALISNGSK